MSNKKNKKSIAKPKIKYDRDYQFEERAERVLDLLRKTNVCTKENLFKYSNHMNKSISKSRFDILLKLKYIKKIPVIDKKTTKVYEAYTLSERGRTYIKDFLGGNIYSSRSTFHDYHQSNFLFENFSIDEIETYKHEKELTAPSKVDVHISIQQKISRPDGQISLSTGETVFIETITKDYSPNKIKAKIRYSSVSNTRCIYNIL